MPASLVSVSEPAAHAYFNQFRMDVLLSLLEYLNQFRSVLSVAVGEERVRGTGVGSTRCTPDTMHVIFNVVWEIVIDDAFHVADVQTTRCHVRRQHDGGFPRTELVQNPVAFVLRLITVDTQRRPSVPSHIHGELVAFTLRFSEYDCFHFLLCHQFLHNTHQFVVFLMLRYNIHYLLVGHEKVKF